MLRDARILVWLLVGGLGFLGGFVGVRLRCGGMCEPEAGAARADTQVRPYVDQKKCGVGGRPECPPAASLLPKNVDRLADKAAETFDRLQQHERRSRDL